MSGFLHIMSNPAVILTLYVNKVTMFLHRRLYCLDISGNIF
ncbi:hypothetical protein ROSINTL182_08489 [Roseburia intestinalis L1-82]|uniref:Uncharacterized protein n=1 Tax=Roseburia intestinalis L1-82 TaxID=536231 RepID=C7GEY7_9FIRM|nr:hypothetical protein ROSINTL182_08489 [Roseburia intestinalis L1-82]